ncbi:hypothetical protein RhiirC2_791942, partial [Rhizophagus irregularis]
MSDIYEVLEVIKEKHWKEKHEENKKEYQRDPSCLKNKPDFKEEGIKSVIKIICEHYMFDEEDNLIINERETEENLLGNQELIKWGNIITDDELDIRFSRFGEWLTEKESVEIKDKGYDTMRNFKTILHLEEKGDMIKEENRGIVKKFQKSITYQWWDGNKYPKPWINDDLTDEIIKKIAETRGFTEEDSDVGELESSNDTG